MAKMLYLEQTLVDEEHPRIAMRRTKQVDISSDHLLPFINTNRHLGLSAGYSTTGSLVSLAIATETKILVIKLADIKPGRDKSKVPKPLQILQDELFCRLESSICAFDLAPLALSLFMDHSIRISVGVDIQSTISPSNRLPIESIRMSANDPDILNVDNIMTIFKDPIFDEKNLSEFALRAWVAQYITNVPHMEERFRSVAKVNTMDMSIEKLEYLGKLAQDTLRLDQKKPSEQKHETTSVWDTNSNQLQVQSNRFQNRVRESAYQQMKIQVGDPNSDGYILQGKITEAAGRNSKLATTSALHQKTVASITSTGPIGPTLAEQQRALFILRVLQGSEGLLNKNPWIQSLWFPSDNPSWPEDWTETVLTPDISHLNRPINKSQVLAVKEMLSHENERRMTLIQGPPGTGKTATIATYVELAIQAGQKGIWLIAQSNVAVKNIAEKLASFEILDWRLIVSRDFRFDWHEHLYLKISSNIIQSDEAFKPSFDIRTFNGCQVVLCTLSMLSNPGLRRIIRSIPVISLVVDEASQIDIGNYTPVFSKYASTLRKMSFIGDNKQLPPFGQEDIGDLKSIFEVSHLQNQVVFLDTQYRMPPQLGNFISDEVYDGKLQSNPQHPVPDTTLAVRFIDTSPASEKSRGTSYMNESERKAVLLLATQLEERSNNYRIITPYDAQRSELENDLKKSDMPWEDKCFNVDSFQGNEEDYIIISSVRTSELGFLKNLRRTNVMLTRCKRGMFICTTKRFVEGIGKKSLVGHLAKKVGESAWLSLKDVQEGNF